MNGINLILNRWFINYNSLKFRLKPPLEIREES